MRSQYSHFQQICQTCSQSRLFAKPPTLHFLLKFSIDFSGRWSHHRFMADVKKLDVGVSNIDFCVDIADVSDDDADVDDTTLSKKPSQRPLHDLMSNIKNGKLFSSQFSFLSKPWPRNFYQGIYFDNQICAKFSIGNLSHSLSLKYCFPKGALAVNLTLTWL